MYNQQGPPLHVHLSFYNGPHNLIYNGSSGPFCAILGFPKKTSRIGEAVVLYFWGFFPSKKQGPNSNQNKRRLDSRYVEDYSYRSQNLKDNAFKLKKLQQRCFLRLTLSRYFQICHLLARLPDLFGVFSEQVGYVFSRSYTQKQILH